MTRRSYKTQVNTGIYTRLCRQLYEIEQEIQSLVEMERHPNRHHPRGRELLQRYYSAFAATSKALDILEERT